MYPIAVAWVIFAIFLLCVIGLSAVFAIVYKTRHEKAYLPVCVTIIGLSTILLYLFIIPVDIFNVSHVDPPSSNESAIRGLYYTGYFLLLLLACVFIPFAYFFFEEDPDDTLRKRILGALKYTAFTVVAALIIIIIGLTLAIANKDTKGKEDWVKYIVDKSKYGDKAIGIMISSLGVLGLVGWTFFTGYGFAALPIDMVRSAFSKGSETIQDDIESDLSIISEKKNSITGRYSLTGRTMSRKDKKELEKLERQERLLKSRSRRLSREISRTSRITKFFSKLIRPFRVIFGIFVGLVIVFVLLSLFLSLIDRLINSSCGISCGFILEKSTIPNPLDLMLVAFSKAFPIDYITLVLFIFVIFFTSIYGISKIGIRFLCLHMYRLKPRRTEPQGLLIACIILMFIAVVFSIQIVAFAPQYATFGSQQTYSDKENKMIPCEMKFVKSVSNITSAINQDNNNDDDNCHLTVLSQVVHGVALRMGFFSVIFYFANWIFIIAVVLSAVIVSIRRARKKYDVESDEDEEFDELDEQEI